jgi:hypothetical protein
MDTAVAFLGLLGDVIEADVAAYTVKELFSELLQYVPRELFLNQDSSTLPGFYMKQECYRAEQRLANHRMTEVRTVAKKFEGRVGLSVEWAVHYRNRDDDEFPIEVQCHQVSRCSHLRDDLLIAADCMRFSEVIAASNLSCP